MASKNDITRRIKNDISRKSGIKSQYASNKISSLKNTINFNAQRISSQPQRPSNLNSRRTLKEINFNAQRVADQFNKRTPNIKDKNVLNNELDYNKLPETLANRSIKIGGPKITPEIPLLTGDFLVRENDLLIATETDKLIEIDSA